MVLVPFEVYAKIDHAGIVGTACAGFSVDSPLPSKISGTDKVIGYINISGIGTQEFGPTTVNANVGEGTHYVVFGVSPEAIVGTYLQLNIYIRLSGLGRVVECRIGTYEAVKYVYITFQVQKTKEGGLTITSIGSGEIAPGGAPIAQPGGGSVFGGGLSEAMADTISVMIENMMPLMIFAMMVNMMMSLITGMMGVFR